MAYQLNEKQGSLFKNEKTNERQPDFRGSIVINGVNYSLSAWSRTSKNGVQYISIQASDSAQPAAGPAAVSRQYQAPAPQNRTYAPPVQPQSAFSAPVPEYGGEQSSFPTSDDIPEDDLPF